jgi:hypothetical protein
MLNLSKRGQLDCPVAAMNVCKNQALNTLVDSRVTSRDTRAAFFVLTGKRNCHCLDVGRERSTLGRKINLAASVTVREGKPA